jgi:hypothetical protein
MSRNAPTLPVNSSTANAVTVPSTTGFIAGDYIYNQNGNFSAIPGNIVSSATFPITGSNMVNYSGMSGGIAAVWNSVGAAKLQRMSAVLTNGNVVTVSSNGITNYPRFRIDTPANVNVVGPTNISTTFNTNGGMIGVLALSGGGFVVYWNNTGTGTVNATAYAIYSNTGSVVTAALVDAASPIMDTANSHMNGIALPNGGFVLVSSISTTSVVQYRIYGSTGTGLYAWTALTACINATSSIGISARSDSSFCISYRSTSTLQTYTIISATNTSLVGVTTFTVVTGSSVYAASVTTLSNDTFAISYTSSSNAGFRLLPTGNTLGSEVLVAFSTNPRAGSICYCNSVLSLAAGNFVFAFVDNRNNINYAFYSNTGTLLSATQLMVESTFNGSGAYTEISLIELTSTVNIYFPNGSVYSSNLGLTTSYFAINKTTFAPVYLGTTTTSAVSNISAPVSGYARAVSTPGASGFLASANQTLTYSVVQTSGNLTSTAINNTSPTAYCCALLNGSGFAVATCSTSTNVSIFIYSITGVLQRTITTSILGTNPGGLRLACMTSGNIVLSVGKTNSVMSIYSPTTGALISTNTITNTYSVANGGTYTQGLCGISGDRFVFYYNDISTSFGKVAIFDNTCTLLNSYSDINSYSVTQNCVSSSLTTSGFWISGFSSTVGGYPVTYFYQDLGGNSFSGVSNLNFSGQTTQLSNSQSVCLSNGVFVCMGANASSFYLNTPCAFAASGSTLNASDGVVFNTMTHGLSCNSFGSPVAISMVAGNTTGGLGYLYVGSAGGALSQTTLNNLSTSSDPQPSLAALYDGTMALVWVDSSLIARFAIINTATLSYSATLVSGTTPSNTVFNPSPANGYTLAGISTTASIAGGTGIIQNNGLAKLNSNYNASQSTIAFDTTNPTTVGVKGLVNGLNVLMQGN